MASLLGAPVEQGRLKALCQRFPEFAGCLPDEAKYWSEADIERFLSSNGEIRPRETAQASQTCDLLTRVRLRLAEERISEATTEYRSFCRHMKARTTARETCEAWKLHTVAECKELPREKACPETLSEPVVIEKQREWKAREWNLDFWSRKFGSCGEEFACHMRSPACEDDVEGADSFSVFAGVHEYVEYAKVIQRMDRKCLEENSIAFPRVALEGWSPFVNVMQQDFEECWQDLSPPGVQDLTAEWSGLFSELFEGDRLQHLAARYWISIGATGTMTRLHVEGAGAHIWLNQVEGRRVFYMFPPEEADKLYSMPMRLKGTAGRTMRASPVDIFFPSARRHPLFSKASARVAMLYLGQTLVVPSGWWWCSIALEPSVTLCHAFWNMENRRYFADGLQDFFNLANAHPEVVRDVEKNLRRINRLIVDSHDLDEDSASDD